MKSFRSVKHSQAVLCSTPSMGQLPIRRIISTNHATTLGAPPTKIGRVQSAACVRESQDSEHATRSRSTCGSAVPTARKWSTTSTTSTTRHKPHRVRSDNENGKHHQARHFNTVTAARMLLGLSTALRRIGCIFVNAFIGCIVVG